MAPYEKGFAFALNGENRAPTIIHDGQSVAVFSDVALRDRVLGLLNENPAPQETVDAD